MKTTLLHILLFLTMLTASAGSGGIGTSRHFEQVAGQYNKLITSLCRHSDGLIWIGTSTGVYRFDGYSISPAPAVESDSITLLTDYILGLWEGPDKKLWIKTQSHYGIYDPRTHEVVEDVTDLLKEKEIDGYINEIESAPDGTLWIHANEKGMFRLKSDPGKAEKCDPLPHPELKVTDITFKGCAPVAVDEAGTLSWINPTTLKLIKSVTLPDVAKITCNDNFQVAADSLDRIWLYATNVLEVYDLKSGKWISDRITAKEKVSSTKNIFHDRGGELWIARDNHGLEKIITRDDGSIILVAADAPGDITYRNTITSFMEDSDGNQWLGSYKIGLLAHNDCIRKFHLEPMPDVNCILPTDNGNIWIGTDNAGILRWNPATGERQEIRDPSEGESHAAVTSLAQGDDGTLYVGSFSRGLRKVSGGRFERITTGTALDNSFVWALTPDRSGKIWIGTLGGGVFLFDPRTSTAVKPEGSETVLPSQFVICGMRSRDGRIYFGTSAGIAYHDPADNRIHRLKELNPAFNTEGWSAVQLYEDTRGLIWVALTNGLKVIDRTHSRITHVETGTSKKHKYVAGIIEDNGGSMWISEGGRLTNLKVAYDDKSGKLSISPREYDIRDGLMDCDLNQRSFAKLPSGEIMAGGLYGINRFTPSEMIFNTARPKVIFTDFFLEGKPVHPGEKIRGKMVIEGSLHDGEGVKLPYNPGEFTIAFTTDNYAIPEKTTYEYKLEGYNNEWRSLTPGQHSITYTNLSPGKYRLLVKGINSDGYESPEPAALDIRIYPPFWATPWAIAIYCILGLLAVAAIVKVAAWLERKRFERRRDEDNRRKQEEINQLKFKFFTNVSHDIRTPLTLIVSPLEEMIKEADDERQRQRLSLMKVNAMRLLTLVNQLLDFRKNEVAGLQLTPTEGDIVGFSRNVCTSFTNLSERKNINLTFYSDRESVNMAFDRDKLEKIFMNLLGNAFKFTPAGGRVDVSLEQVGEENPMLRIKVADTGIGIKDKDKEHIFERFYQIDDNGESHPHMGSGIGLSMVSEYVKVHEGTIRVTDNVDRGSVFIIDLPIRHVSLMVHMTEETDREDNNNIIIAQPESVEQSPAGDCSPEREGAQRPVALVVDDNRDMTDMLKFELENDFDIITANSGEEALRIIENVQPAIILTDLMMPGIDGIELCRRLKSREDMAAVPLIILTAKHDLGVKLEGLTLGADDYITKPFNLDVLRLRMKRLVQLTERGARRSLIEPEPESIAITPLDEQFIEKAMKYVSDNIDSSALSVEELSEKLGMSRVRLYKKIKQITGKTPIEFIRVIRLKRAAQLLRESQLNVSEIAYRTGFNSPKVFSKYFKEEFGILPSLYQDKEGAETNYTV